MKERTEGRLVYDLGYVPLRRQIYAARASVRLAERAREEVPEDIAAIAAWPMDQARDGVAKDAVQAS